MTEGWGREMVILCNYMNIYFYGRHGYLAVSALEVTLRWTYISSRYNNDTPDVSFHENQCKLQCDGLFSLSVYVRLLLLLLRESRLGMYFTLYLLQNLPPQNVFAYLPLRSYGFRFIIQGDFEVPSSREDVDSDNSWNQWLREEIPRLFIDALSVFMVGSSQSFCF